MNTYSAPAPKASLWPFFWAIAVPVIGFILGIVEAAKRSTGRGGAIMALSIVAVFGWMLFLMALFAIATT
jgi:hypothetical protein